MRSYLGEHIPILPHLLRVYLLLLYQRRIKYSHRGYEDSNPAASVHIPNAAFLFMANVLHTLMCLTFLKH